MEVEEKEAAASGASTGESNGDQVLLIAPPPAAIPDTPGKEATGKDSWLATWKAKVSKHIKDNYDTLSTNTAGLISQAEEYIAKDRSYKIKDKKVYGGLITFFVVSAALVIERVKANRKFNICKKENETLQLKNDDLKIENDGLKATVSALQKQIAILKAAAVDNQSAANVVRQTATAAAKASANANRAKRTRAKSTSSPASRAPSTKRGRTSRSR